MKKRYLASPLIVLAVAAAWNVTLRQRTPVATAEELNAYIAPSVADARHPINVYHMSVADGETESEVLAHISDTIYPEDRVTFLIDPKLGLGTIVHVERALPVTVKDGRRVVQTRTWANTVEELLTDINRSLGELDKANYPASAPLETNMTIEITRVSKTNVTVREVVAFETVKKSDPSEYRGVTKVSQEGKNGERTKVYEVTREDGEEVSRRLVRNEVTTKPVNKVIVTGTKLKIGKTASGKATWYDLCCKKVASNVFKKGTVVRVTNLNTGKSIEVTVDDTGGFGSDIVIDLHPSYFQQLGGTLGQGVMQRVLVEEILNP